MVVNDTTFTLGEKVNKERPNGRSTKNVRMTVLKETERSSC